MEQTEALIICNKDEYVDYAVFATDVTEDADYTSVKSVRIYNIKTHIEAVFIYDSFVSKAAVIRAQLLLVAHKRLSGSDVGTTHPQYITLKRYRLGVEK